MHEFESCRFWWIFVVDCRFWPFDVDVDFLQILFVDCRPKGQKNFNLHLGWPPYQPPQNTTNINLIWSLFCFS